MNKEKGNKVYCTNVDESDPIIEKFMKEYLKEKEECDEERKPDDLIVNFDISHGDGTHENYTCGSESEVFDIQDTCGCIETKIEPEEMKCYYEDKDIDMNIKFDEEPCDFPSNHDDIEYYDDEDEHKWGNCEDEWCEPCKNYDSSESDVECKEKEVSGQIIVYSTLCSKDGTRIRGIKINLYRLNGICPELVDSKETDFDGRVVFCNVPEGSYRVIELIDKRYFEKPSYINWNEATIDECNTCSTIYAINRVKTQRGCNCRRGH